MKTVKNLLMEVSENSLFLEGFALANNHVIVISKLPLLETMQQQATIIEAMITCVGISLSYMKN